MEKVPAVARHSAVIHVSRDHALGCLLGESMVDFNFSDMCIMGYGWNMDQCIAMEHARELSNNSLSESQNNKVMQL